MCFGIISNPKIAKIKIVETAKNIEVTAKIAQGNNYRVWWTDMKNFEGSKFEILGLTKDNNEVVKYSDNISPGKISQAPIKME